MKRTSLTVTSLVSLLGLGKATKGCQFTNEMFADLYARYITWFCVHS